VAAHPFTRAIVRPPAGNFAAGLSSAAEGAPDLDRADAAESGRRGRECVLRRSILNPNQMLQEDP
jgi:hypothetical protein